MVVNVVDVAGTQFMSSSPIPTFDAAMNLMGYARGIGVSVNNYLVLIVDAFFKKEGGKEEYEEYMKLAREVFEKGTGITTLKKIFELYKKEIPDIFESRRVYFEITDPKLDITMGIMGIRLNIVWDYDTGRYSMFYLPPLDMVDDLNTKIAHLLGLVRGITGRLRDLARLKAENRDLRARVGVLEDALDKVLKSNEEMVGRLGNLQRELVKLRLDVSNSVDGETLSNRLNSIKTVIEDVTSWAESNIKMVTRSRTAVVESETELFTKFKALAETVRAITTPSLTDEQIAEILQDVIARNPEWVRTQLERYKVALGTVTPPMMPEVVRKEEVVEGEEEEVE